MPPPENMSIIEKCAFLAGELVKQSEPIFDPPVFEADKTPFTFPMPTGVVPVGGAGAAGAGVGALIGALRAPKGKMLKYTLGGAGIGGLAGMGSAAGYNLGSGLFDTGEKSLHPAAPIRLPLALGGGAVAAHLGNKLYNEVEHHIPEKEDKKDKKDKKNKKDEKAAQLRNFGAMIANGYKESANPAAHAEQAALNTNYMHGLRDSGLLSGQEHYAPMSTAMSKDPAILNRIGHAQLPTRGSELLGGTGPNAVLGRLTRDATDDTAQTFRNVRQQYKPSLGAGMTKTQSARMSHHGMDMTGLGMLGGVTGA